MIEVKVIPHKGRCIVATQMISAGTLIEVAPVSTFPAEQRWSLEKTEIFKYCFVRPIEYSKSKKTQGYLVFGLASLCSHHENPNAYINWIENEAGIWSHLVAKKEIEIGEEKHQLTYDQQNGISLEKAQKIVQEILKNEHSGD